jgi:hypothetical protein
MNRKWISSAGVVHDHSESCCAGLCGIVFAVSRPVSHQTYQLFIEYHVWRQLLCKPQKRSASPSAGASPRSLHTDNQR